MDQAGDPQATQLYDYKVVKEYPHDPDAFTQGLEFDRRCDSGNYCRDIFWESTGRRHS